MKLTKITLALTAALLPTYVSWAEQFHDPAATTDGLDGATRWSIGAIDGAYKGVAIRRALAMLDVDGLAEPLILDLLQASSSGRHVYDLPLHFSGHIIDSDIEFARNLAERPVLGSAHGYQHLWVDGEGSKAGKARLTWMKASRFYSYHALPPAGARYLVVESGANDPEFNLRREPALIQRVEGATDARFVGLLEPHGSYDASAETVVASSANPSAPETNDPSRMPSFARLCVASSVNARAAMNSDIVKPMPVRTDTP